MPSIFADIKEENQSGKSIFQQNKGVGESIFKNIEPTQKISQKSQPPVYSQEDLARKILPQLTAGMAEQTPFAQSKALSIKYPVPLEQMPAPQGLPAKIARAGGSLLGMLPSFMIGGIGGGAVARGVTGKLVTQLPRLAKYIGASAGGATTFMGARALRNIGQNQPVTQGLPEEAVMGAVFGPTNLIRSYPGAIATSTGLGAIMAPPGEKLAQSILFGGLTAFTHQRPDLSFRDKANIDTLYREATFKEGVREVQRGITQRQLPAPETIYGKGFTATQPITKIPVSEQKLIGGKTQAQLSYEPALGQGIRQGEGFTVVGGKTIKRPIAKAQAKELRTTPTPEETIAITQPQVQKDIQEARAKKIVSGVVVTPKDLEPISQPIGEKVLKIDKESISAGRGAIPGEVLQTYNKGKLGLFINEEGKYYLKRNDGTFVYNPKTESALFDNVETAEKEYIRQLSKPTGEGQKPAEPTTVTVTPLAKKAIPKIKFGEVPYRYNAKKKIVGLKQERHLLLPEEKVELQNQLANAIANAPEQGKYAKPIKIKIGNWELKLENDKEKLVNFSNIVNKRGSVVIPPELTEPIEQTATQIYRGIAPAGEVLRNDKLVNSIMQERQRKMTEIQSGELPQSMVAQRLKEINDSEKTIQAINQSGGKDESILVSRAADAIDKERMFVTKYAQIIDLANKVGITEGSKASEVVFRALDYRRATPEEIAKLTPDQQKFIPIIRNAYKEIWKATGKPEYESVRDYATHLIQTGKEMGYDVSALGRFLPDELYSRFFETRKGAKPYQQDIIKALDVYIPSVARKIFREPVLQEYNNILDPHLNIEYKNEAVDFMEAFLGRGRYGREGVLERLSKGLVRLTYRGTLYGNFSAATKNATQVLTNTIPEIGGKSVMYGYKRLMTPEGRQEFVNSGLSGDFSLGKPINQLDFFSQVEFLNRGVTYLGAKHKALSEGKNLFEAENYAKKIVRKTQFIQTGIDTPKLYRQYGGVGRMLGQFTQFPTKQGFLLWNWARQGQWDKVARFATIAYLLGGTRTVPFLDGIIDGDYKMLPQMPEDTRKLIRNVEKYTSLAGLSGIDIGQNFGFGIYGGSVPLGRGPALGLFKEMGSFVKALGTHEITNLQDIIRSRLVQKSLPTLITGGVAVKKLIDLINADENDYKIRNAYNQLQYESSPKEEILRILVGPTKERKEAWESLSKERKEAEIYRNEHRKMLDYILDSKGDTMALEEFIKKYPKYGDGDPMGKVINELMERAKNRNLPADVREYLTRPKALR